jgi:hypothetical protein
MVLSLLSFISVDANENTCMVLSLLSFISVDANENTCMDRNKWQK